MDSQYQTLIVFVYLCLDLFVTLCYKSKAHFQFKRFVYKFRFKFYKFGRGGKDRHSALKSFTNMTPHTKNPLLYPDVCHISFCVFIFLILSFTYIPQQFKPAWLLIVLQYSYHAPTNIHSSCCAEHFGINLTLWYYILLFFLSPLNFCFVVTIAYSITDKGGFPFPCIV